MVTTADPLTKMAYQALQRSKSYFGTTHKLLSSRLLQALYPPPEHLQTHAIDAEVVGELYQWLEAIQEQDWADGEAGVYPISLLFQEPWGEFLHTYPLVWLDLPRIWERAHQRRYQDFPPDLDTTGYPEYYLQNFHHQTDGYLSDYSAQLYDLQVEILFNGAADAMRRRILAPLKRALGSVVASRQRILDVACGTGRTLKFLRSTFPSAQLFGLDLSAPYLRKATQLLTQIPGELPQLVQANAEELPYQDNYFHALTSVFLFHELPPPVRQRVIEECYRVIQPGGVLVLCDSIQAADFPHLTPVMENFSRMFHEPYYRHYMYDDLEGHLVQGGFVDIHTTYHFMSKYWVAHKPHF